MCSRESVNETNFENQAKIVAWQRVKEQIKGILVAAFLTVDLTQL